MARPARDDYPLLASRALLDATLGPEAIKALAEIDKWRIRNEADEKAWQIEMGSD